MKNRIISFGGISLKVEYPAHLEEAITALLSGFQLVEDVEKCIELRVSDDPENNQILTQSISRDVDTILDVNEMGEGFLSFLTSEITTAIDDRMVFHSGAVNFSGHNIMIAGPTAVGKSMLTAWFISKGHLYLTDNKLTCLDMDHHSLESLPGPLNIRSGDYPEVAALLDNKIDHHQTGKKVNLTYIQSENIAADDHQTPSLIIFPHFSPGQSLLLEPLSSAKTGLKLMNCLVNGQNLGGQGLRQVSALARKIDAFNLTYGATEQLDNLSETILRFIIDHGYPPSEVVNFFTQYQKGNQHSLRTTPAPPTTPEKNEIPEPTPAGPKKRLTIGMATYNDFDGVYFTVQAIRMYHPEITESTEILVIDNNPEGPCARALKQLEEHVEGYRYLPFQDQSGTAVRDHIFRQANSDYVLSIDCHVLIVPGALKKLIAYLDQRKECQDLLQGPMLHDNHTKISTHFAPEWKEGMYGFWGTDQQADDPDSKPFEITMQGLGLFACRKDAWVGFNSRFRGFGGEEGYLHEKFRQSGGKSYCLPFLRWMHRFPRPMGIPYSINWKDRIHNYMVGFQELALDTGPIKAHFTDYLGDTSAKEIFQEIEAELKSPFFYFDAIYCITMDQDSKRWQKMQKRFSTLGIEQKVRIFNAIATPDNHHIGCALSHRSIIKRAQQQDLSNVLVFEDDAIFLDETIDYLSNTVKELKKQDWQIFYLGGHKWGQTFPKADQCLHLTRPKNLTCTHAIAYNNVVFDKILEDIPETIDATVEWAKTHIAIDQYLRNLSGLYLAEPVVASQNQLLRQEKEEHRLRFTLGEE